MDYETIQKASGVYFALLKERVIDDSSEYFDTFYESNVREAVMTLASESKTQIIEAQKRIHLVTKSDGSVFATNFSHLKKKYSDIENKKFFHLICVVIMTFLAKIDKNQAAKIRYQREGITFYALERDVEDLIHNWRVIIKDAPDYAKDVMIDMETVVELWTNMESEDENMESKRPNKKTRIGVITSAMKLLENECLIVVLDKYEVPNALPKKELFERIEYLYHDYDRYEEFKEIINKRDEEYAKN